MTESENRAARAGEGGWIAAAALSGAVAVAAGAFAAHGLDATREAAEIGWLHTGSLYQALHAMALLAVVALDRQGLLQPKLAASSRILFLAGAILFPAALYGLALHGPRWLGAVAPIGGTAFILGWIALALAAIGRADSREQR
jgi:uncharacterized membrane protein YgdD (TMEM256/DUF423 family)